MRVLTTAAALAALALPAWAQRADENAVKTAADAFGTSVGNEQIGLYNPFEVRGFSAIDAGNARIEGLYFDRQYDPTQLISPGNTMRVGISAQGYPLPAPTGIVDYELVRVGDKRVTSAVASIGPFGSLIGDLEMKLPIVPGRFGVAVGVSGNRFTYETGGKEKNASFSVAAQWRPIEGVEVIPFFGRAYVRDSEQPPLIFVSGAFLPPKPDRGFFYGQDWARAKWQGTNYGVVNTAVLAGGWTVKAGLFRSIFDGERGFVDLFLETGPTGLAQTHLMVADPPTRFGSTSGEGRLSRTFDLGETRNTFHLIVRGRDQHRRYGGSDLIDFGPAQAGVKIDLPEPDFAFGPQTRERVRQVTGAVAYQGRFDDAFELSLGLQRTRYRKTVTAPASAPVIGRDNAWLHSLAGAWRASKALAVYGSYTTGLEEGGIAPPNAANKDFAPPAIRTKQVDTGVRYAITPELRVVAGVFDIEKPYYNLDAANLYRRLGTERHRGAEFSIAGQPVKGLNVVAGMVLMKPRVTGEEVDAGLIGKIPVAQLKRLAIVGVDWQTPWIEALSVNATLTAIGERQASSDNLLSIPSREVLDMGARYRFEIEGAPASVRVQVGNVTNLFGWRTNQGAVFTPNAQRRYSVTLAADF